MCTKCRFCCFGRSASVIIAAVYTLIESILFFAAACTAVFVHLCRTSMDANRYLYGFYLTYFRNPECGDVDLSKLVPSIELPELPQFVAGMTDPVERTVLFSWLYVCFNGFWIVASMLLLVGGVRSCSGRCGHYFFWLPWIFATMSNIVLDIVVAIYYGKDLKQTNSLDNFLDWLGLLNIDKIKPLIPEYESQVLSIPTYIMIGFSLRGILFELINIFYLIVVTFIWFEILNEFVDEKPREFIRAYESQHAVVNNAYVPDPLDHGSNHSGSTNTFTPQPQMNGNRFIKNNERVADRDEEVERRLKKYQTTTLQSKTNNNEENFSQIRRSQSAEKQIIRRPMPVEQPIIITQRQSAPKQELPYEPDPDYIIPDSPYTILPIPGIPAPDYDLAPEENEPKSHNKVVRSTSNVQNLRQTLEKRASEKPHERSMSPVPGDGSNADERHVSRNSSFVNRPELRNQLPWSYFSKGEDIAPAKSYVHPITGERMFRTALPPVFDSNSPPEATSEPPSDNEAASRF